MLLAAGEVFAGYTVVRVLGSDGVGEVYLAGHPRLPRRDAIRVLPASLSADAEFRARFAREADLAATLWHPHIVGVHDRGEFDGLLWMAMDFIDGSDAARLVHDRYPSGLPAEQALDVVTAVADALDYSHGRQVLHGDVTPASILITESPGRRILLTGFGIPRSGGPADQYALAVTALHLLTGGHPSDLDPAIVRALSEDPSARFDTCLGFAHALRDGVTNAANTVASPIWTIDPPTEQFTPATGPEQPVFVPAWSEEPAPDPYLDGYVDDPYPDPDPAHSPTMTAMPVPDPPPPAAPEQPVEHPADPTGRTWAMAGVTAVIVLVIVVVVFVARGGGDEQAQPSAGPQISSEQPPPPQPLPLPQPPAAPPTGTERARVTPPPVAGADGKGETCEDGYQITGRTEWASQGVRGNPAATCVFVGNVLKAYWDAADPSDAPRTVIAAGAIPCTAGAECSGEDFVVSCAVEGSDPWITCRGGRGAVVYLY